MVQIVICGQQLRVLGAVPDVLSIKVVVIEALDAEELDLAHWAVCQDGRAVGAVDGSDLCVSLSRFLVLGRGVIVYAVYDPGDQVIGLVSVTSARVGMTELRIRVNVCCPLGVEHDAVTSTMSWAP